MKAERGFTLAELVIVMVITGVLAAVAVPKLFDKNEFAARGARDVVASALRYAQKSAIAMRRNVCTSIAASVLDVTYASASGNDQACVAANKVINPGNSLPFNDATNALPGGATVTAGVDVVFDSMGRPSSAPATPLTAALAITVTGNAAHPITVEPETGYVH